MDLRHDIRVGEATLEAAQHLIQRGKVKLVFSDPAQVQKRRQFDTRKKSKAGCVEAAGVVIHDFLRKMEQRGSRQSIDDQGRTPLMEPHRHMRALRHSGPQDTIHEDEAREDDKSSVATSSPAIGLVQEHGDDLPAGQTEVRRVGTFGPE